MMTDNKKKKVIVPAPEKLSGETNNLKLSLVVMQKMDKDIQTRIVFSALNLNTDWLYKIFATGCEEMYVRTILKELPNHTQKNKKILLDDLKAFGYIINKNIS